MSRRNAELPQAQWWPQPITADQYLAFTPEKLELVSGYLIEGSESPESRRVLLALLLMNCGLEEAVSLAPPERWREAVERAYGQ